MPHVAGGRPAGIGILVVTRATDPSKPFSIRSLTSITRHSLRLWQSRERNCRAMCNGNLKNFSNAGGWSMAFYGFAASLAHAEHLVAFSCKRRGFCPSCGARRMAESAALLVDEVLPEQPMRQWVLSFPFQLRFLFGVVCGKGRNPTLRLWPAIFSGEIDVFPGDRRSRLISSMTSVAPA
ncbi:transposase zinc-binding domain-containing protein [Klebsiella michiganensis]|uniref:transposase zinc-binding domain-containing protein n=1 Tax=Klebsiella michiganensis TaxID=1134687 RepID=UPI0038910BF4